MSLFLTLFVFRRNQKTLLLLHSSFSSPCLRESLNNKKKALIMEVKAVVTQSINPTFSCETIGIPLNLVMAPDLLNGNAIQSREHPLFPYILQCNLPFGVLNAIVEDVRATDTPLAYNMGRTFIRGQLASSAIKWTATVLLQAQMAALNKKFPGLDQEEVILRYATLHFRRSKQTCVNPLTPEQDIMMLVSRPDQGLRWFDLTASNDPVQHLDYQPRPKRRANAFVVTDTSLVQYKRSCLHCSNRAQNDCNYMKCGRCLLARYCSRECQRLDWSPYHRGSECNQMQESVYASD